MEGLSKFSFVVDSSLCDIWFVGSVIRDVKPNCVTRKISVPNATLNQLIEITKVQLQLYCINASKSGVEPKKVYIIFAVGIHDLAPSPDLSMVVSALNKLVCCQATLREKLGSCVSNIGFASLYPPCMERLGAAQIVFHAQQLINLVFCFYNKWVEIINAYNRSGTLHLCQPFSYTREDLLDVNQLEDDGIMPSPATAIALAGCVDRSIRKNGRTWLFNNTSTTNGNVTMLMVPIWHALLRADLVYLQAFSGADITEHVVNVPFRSITMADRGPAEDKRSRDFLGQQATNVNVVELQTYKICDGLARLVSEDKRDLAYDLLDKFKKEEEAVLLQRIVDDRERLAAFQECLKAIEDTAPKAIEVKKVLYKDPYASTEYISYDPSDPYAVPPDAFEEDEIQQLPAPPYTLDSEPDIKNTEDVVPLKQKVILPPPEKLHTTAAIPLSKSGNVNLRTKRSYSDGDNNINVKYRCEAPLKVQFGEPARRKMLGFNSEDNFESFPSGVNAPARQPVRDSYPPSLMDIPTAKVENCWKFSRARRPVGDSHPPSLMDIPMDNCWTFPPSRQPARDSHLPSLMDIPTTGILRDRCPPSLLDIPTVKIDNCWT